MGGSGRKSNSRPDSKCVHDDPLWDRFYKRGLGHAWRCRTPTEHPYYHPPAGRATLKPGQSGHRAGGGGKMGITAPINPRRSRKPLLSNRPLRLWGPAKEGAQHGEQPVVFHLRWQLVPSGDAKRQHRVLGRRRPKLTGTEEKFSGHPIVVVFGASKRWKPPTKKWRPGAMVVAPGFWTFQVRVVINRQQLSSGDGERSRRLRQETPPKSR
jgi:hypothetical protein